MKKAILIAGATGGLGQALANKFLSWNQSLVLVGRSIEKLNKLAEKLAEKDNCYLIQADLTQVDQITGIYQKIKELNLELEYLINCVGKGYFGSVGTYSYPQILQAMEINLVGPIELCQRAFLLMKEQAGGYIVNVISTAALEGKANESIYCAAKWGLRGFTEALRKEASQTKVGILGVYPGGMQTDFFTKAVGGDYELADFMKPEDVAEVICHSLKQYQNLEVSQLVIRRKK